MASDHEIELLYLCDAESDDEQYPPVRKFPSQPVALEPFPYEQFRALLISEQEQGFNPSEADRALLKSFSEVRLI